MNLDKLLDLLACPVTGESLLFEPTGKDEGLLTSAAGQVYPVIGGVPRLLPPDLLGPFLRGAYPEVLKREPRLAAALRDAPEPEPEVLETLIAYSHQHLDLKDDLLLIDDWRLTWDRFQPGSSPESYSGRVVLEAGCGEGRHAYLVAPHASILVGLDLSRGVELSRLRDQSPTSFYVQADLRRPPFKPGVFDAFYSNGVLHHTPVPAESFAACARLLRVGGKANIWVYGLEEMRLTYRLSHLTWLRPLTGRLPKRAQEALAVGMTAALEVGLWAPTRGLYGLGMTSLAERLPYHDAASRDFKYKKRRMFDRLNPPITFYPTQTELRGWYDGFDEVVVTNADGQGWAVSGLKSKRL
ncbi:MAG: methyltransferase domain-containing protein [Myxococcales bacterium]|nr:methyltransferase domain-containing protein [Myxococcales bacterium]